MVECSYCQFQFGYKNDLNEIRHLVTKIVFSWGPSHFANNTHWKCVYLFIHLCVLTYDPPWPSDSSLYKEFNMLSVIRMQNAHILLKRRYTSCFHPSWQLLLHHARLAPSLFTFIRVTFHEGWSGRQLIYPGKSTVEQVHTFKLPLQSLVGLLLESWSRLCHNP